MPEKDLDRLLKTMRPQLDAREWVFSTVDASIAADLNPIATFVEDEGLTVVIEAAVALERGIENAFPSRRITLAVHSDLEAVGFLATVTFELARFGIAANAFCGFHHDHIFVPATRAAEAMRVLEELSASVR